MKKVLALLMGCSLLFMGCRYDDVLESDTVQNNEKVGLKGKSFVVNQSELEAKYLGNKNLTTILQNEFKTDSGLVKTTSEGEDNGVYIDLDHIQVFESEQMHTITYYVGIGEQEETDEPQELYNLMYFSKDYENYYVSLLKYDFSEISIVDFGHNPTLDIVNIIPLNDDIEDIYENINYSTSSVDNSVPVLSEDLRNLADCVKITNVPSTPCQHCERAYGEPGCKNKDKHTQAQPPKIIWDFTGCDLTTPGNGGGGGGSVGIPGDSFPGGLPGGGGSGGWSSPIKHPIDLIEIGDILLDPNIGTFNTNLKTLKGLVENNLATLQALHSNASDPLEHGNAFSKQKINNQYTPIANQTPLQLANGSNWALNIIPAVKVAANTGILHTHTNKNTSIIENGKEVKAVPMFSHTDLRALFYLGQSFPTSNKALPDLFFGLMTSESLYVVMFPNDATKINFVTKYGTSFYTWRIKV